MQLFTEFKTLLLSGFRATLNFRSSSSAVKNCMLSCLSQFNNKKWGPYRARFLVKHLKLKLRVFLAGHIVGMVTCYIKRMTATCSPMTGHLCDTIIVTPLVKQW